MDCITPVTDRLLDEDSVQMDNPPPSAREDDDFSVDSNFLDDHNLLNLIETKGDRVVWEFDGLSNHSSDDSQPWSPDLLPMSPATQDRADKYQGPSHQSTDEDDRVDTHQRGDHNNHHGFIKHEQPQDNTTEIRLVSRTTIEECHDEDPEDEDAPVYTAEVDCSRQVIDSLPCLVFPPVGPYNTDVTTPHLIPDAPSTSVSNVPEESVARPTKRVNKGGRPRTHPYNPQLPSYSNTRERQKMESCKISSQLAKLEKEFLKIYSRAVLDQWYKGNGIIDDPEEKEPRKPKRETAESEEVRVARIKEQNREKCKKSRDKKKRLKENEELKRDLLMYKSGFSLAQLVKLDVVKVKVEPK